MRTMLIRLLKLSTLSSLINQNLIAYLKAPQLRGAFVLFITLIVILVGILKFKNLGRAFLKARGFGQCPRKGVSIANYMA